MHKQLYFFIFVIISTTGLISASDSENTLQQSGKKARTHKHNEGPIATLPLIEAFGHASTTSSSSSSSGREILTHQAKRTTREAECQQDPFVETAQATLLWAINESPQEACQILTDIKQELPSDSFQQILNYLPFIEYLHKLADKKAFKTITEFDKAGLIPKLDKHIPGNSALLEKLDSLLVKIETTPTTTHYTLRTYIEKLSGTINYLLNPPSFQDEEGNMKSSLPDERALWAPICMHHISAATFETVRHMEKIVKQVDASWAAQRENPHEDDESYAYYLGEIAQEADFMSNQHMSIDGISALFNAMSFLDITKRELIVAAGSAARKWAEEVPSRRWSELNKLSYFARQIIYENLLETQKEIPYSKSNELISVSLYNTNMDFNVSVRDLISWDIINWTGIKYETKEETSYFLNDLFIRSLTGLEYLPHADKVTYLALEHNQLDRLAGDDFKYLPNLEEIDLKANAFVDTTAIDPDVFKQLPRLQKMNLEGNPICCEESWKEEINTIAQAAIGNRAQNISFLNQGSQYE